MGRLVSEKTDVIQTQIDVSVIKAGQLETNRRLSNIEKKMDNFTFVKQDDFIEFKKEAASSFVTKEEFKPVKNLFWAIITALIVGLITVAFTALKVAK